LAPVFARSALANRHDRGQFIPELATIARCRAVASLALG
jgi:hypothetical protein